MKANVEEETKNIDNYYKKLSVRLENKIETINQQFLLFVVL